MLVRLIQITACLIGLSLSTQAAAHGWEGFIVRIDAGALICNQASIGPALIARAAGDQASVDALVASGDCQITGQVNTAPVTQDLSETTDPDVIEVTIGGESLWMGVAEAACCE